ncbi:DUF664 domain-containing protein [Nakamurella deserti]|uniref:mycothiol transferase n=1 Tax=Nakamurella deserti TaxID=2164074 RepID=UPI000DBE9B85|nr:DUF664 domain-containing protein [Nakamurella deserti]
MTTPDTAGDFPPAGTETQNLLGALDRIRRTFHWKCSGLDAAAMRTPLAPSSMTLGGLVRHLAFVEQVTFTWTLRGADPGPPWNEDHDEPDWEWSTAAAHTPDELLAAWRAAVAASEAAVTAAVADGGLDAMTAVPKGEGPLNVRRLVVDMIEEYARHTGHADLIRESIDGLVGEDPPR